MNEDLSGAWRGIFNYPKLLPPTEFEAELRDLGGALSGITSEPDLMGRGTLQAVIEGRREGRLVRFSKTYDDMLSVRETVHYEGTVQPDGDEIHGKWTIPGNWSGTFIMIRGSPAAESAERQVGERV